MLSKPVEVQTTMSERTMSSAVPSQPMASVLGSAAFGLLSALPVIARQPRLAPALAADGPYLILGYAQGVAVLVGFLLLSVLGLA
jgi:hypothetical protein